MPASEYAGWIEYHKRVPFRAEVQELQLATLALMIYAANKAENAEDKTLIDFMPTQREPGVSVKITPAKATMQTMEELEPINRSMEIFKRQLSQVQ